MKPETVESPPAGRRLEPLVGRCVQLFDRFLIWLSANSIEREAVRRRATLAGMKHCEMAGCKQTAVHFVKWGRDVRQQGNLCGIHLRETWEQCQPQVAVGLCWWEQSLPKWD